MIFSNEGSSVIHSCIKINNFDMFFFHCKGRRHEKKLSRRINELSEDNEGVPASKNLRIVVGTIMMFHFEYRYC